MVGGRILCQDQLATCLGRFDRADADGYVGGVGGVFRWVVLVVRDLGYNP